MPNQIIKAIALLTLTSSVFISCGDQAQEAAEEANKDTVPVIETRPDSVKTDSVIPH